MKKRHGQYCPIARTLDLVGDRWSLLILRELLFGDQRFVDLREHLPGISPTLLTEMGSKGGPPADTRRAVLARSI